MSVQAEDIEMNNEEEKEPTKRRVRPRTKAIRVELKNKIEAALLSKNSPILHVFKSSGGTDLSAPLDEVLPLLGYDENSPVKKLTKFQLRSISNVSRVFNIIGMDNEPLQIVFDSRYRENLDDKTVYVDNLPPSCSEEQLRRRASVFGNIVHMHMPYISRLRRRCAMGVEAPLNSGFAFIQFSSKTAVRRFCKRYAVNCHLNRPHHPKANRKRKSQLQISGANAQPIVANPETPAADASKPTPANESASSQQLAANMGDSSIRRKRRSTEVSISGLDSGTESDFAKPKPISRQSKPEEEKPKKKRTRKRRTLLPAYSLTKFLSKIQVFPYQKYKELRQEYLQMKNANLKTLKADLRDQGLIPPSESDVENIDYSKAEGQVRPPRRRKRPRTRPQQQGGSSTAGQTRKKTTRSRANVMKTAMKIKDESFWIPEGGDQNTV